MKQTRLDFRATATSGFEKYRKRTRRETFLAEVHRAIGWNALRSIVVAHHPVPGPGRRGDRIDRLLRILLLQDWYALNDGAVYEALYDSAAMRAFVGVDLAQEPLPEPSELAAFHRLLEQHGLDARIRDAVDRALQAQGLAIAGGSIVEASLRVEADPTAERARVRRQSLP